MLVAAIALNVIRPVLFGSAPACVHPEGCWVGNRALAVTDLCCNHEGQEGSTAIHSPDPHKFSLIFIIVEGTHVALAYFQASVCSWPPDNPTSKQTYMHMRLGKTNNYTQILRTRL